jgi:threonine dehydrogenase-like Zn-dependent dehydrogenase
MKALCWNGKLDVRVENVPDPKILNERDVIIRITSTTICGSDLHLYDGIVKGMLPGDILGHEFMGEVVEVGPGVKNLSIGDRVVVPFAISCGGCYFCQNQLWSLCDNSNPNAAILEGMYGFTGAGLFGYSHLYGGFAGGQAEYARVPFADVGPLKVPEGMSDEQVLFLTDILPTGYMAAENGSIQPGDVVAVWGCGPVGLMAIVSAFMLGADRVIAIDNIPMRLEMARGCGAEPLNFEGTDTVEALKQMTGGRGPDVCIEAVGLEAHGFTVDALLDRAQYFLKLTTDNAHALRQAIQACRKGGTVSVPGVYAGAINLFPFGAAFAKGLQMRMGQTHVHAYMQPLLERIQRGELDPTFVITHHMPLEEAPHGYEIFKNKRNEVVKIILKP